MPSPRSSKWRRSCPRDHLMVVNLSGRGDKDIFTVAEHLGGDCDGRHAGRRRRPRSSTPPPRSGRRARVLRLGHWPAGPARLKAYGILADAAPALGPGVVAAARAVVEGQGPAIAATDHRGVGFVILHRGAEGDLAAAALVGRRRHLRPAAAGAAGSDGAAAFEPLDRPADGLRLGARTDRP